MSDIDFELNPITEQEVINILGSNYKAQGQELVWKCPACPGGDKHGDNLKFNRQKQVLKCFACDFAEEITGIIARRRFEAQNGEQGQDDYTFTRREPDEATEQPVKEKEIKQEDLSEYYFNCNNALMANKNYS